ncbi:MAG TPA: hypothetical protein VHA33_20700 [Candidatus Angelobacter sp.]|jgi:DNA-directed RNA polymerase subunit K/omega|nr:hypothetical protein [Candidatus Angelobacter sp.]
MRSEHVFAAVKEIGNRFLLCRVAAVSARRLHQDSTQPSEAISKSFKLIATGESEEQQKALSCGKLSQAGAVTAPARPDDASA